jgi:hypothetical protein
VAAVVALLAAVAPAMAETYHVKTVAGDEFLTRYQPEEASWDNGQILFLTEVGNWIALPKDDVAGITTETENKGYGRVIDTTTIALGRSPNDAATPEEEAAQKQDSPMDALRSLLSQQQPSYSVQQFVEPSEAGGGLPVSFGFGYSPPTLPTNP